VELPRWSLAPASFDQAAARATSAPSRFGEVEPAKPATPLPAWWPDRDERPLVYVSFGSVAAGIGLFPGLYMRVLELMADLPVRVLLTLGQAGDPDALGSVPPNAHIERWWPQDQLRPHLAAVVGHGGFGTTLAALTAGIPQVVVPLFASDQFANATRVAAIGAGMALSEPDPLDRPAAEMLPRGPRTVEDLPAAVTRVLDDESVRQAARAVAAEIAGLPDVRTCTEFLAQLTGTG
jgi:UDP:flavonoid glycosyltransferase YjiC (YdhE family)